MRLLPLIALACLLSAASACAEKMPPGDNGGQVMCTMEAKLCPDGVTSVGRTGPNCAFAPCPGEQPATPPGDKPEATRPQDSAPGGAGGSEGRNGVEDVPGSYE
ncbi:MAG TPA: hypothetical protein VEF76_09595 [Patescibacteria group bacterium]|nr:hypothetical protein [Patescibacteria group bacterium]